MGKQINYWMDFNTFKTLVSEALKFGCDIFPFGNPSTKIEHIDQLEPDILQYFFFISQADELQSIDSSLENCYLDEMFSKGIEVSFSKIDCNKKHISRARIYVNSGYWDDNDEWISQNKLVIKTYNRLAGIVKKLCPYTSLTSSYISTKDETYGQQITDQHKEYISPLCLNLREKQNYRIFDNPLYE